MRPTIPALVLALACFGAFMASSADAQQYSYPGNPVTFGNPAASAGACSTTKQGLVPATGGGTSTFLRADCTFAAPTGFPTGTGAVDQVVVWSGASTQTGFTGFKYKLNDVLADTLRISDTTDRQQLIRLTNVFGTNNAFGVQLQSQNAASGTYAGGWFAVAQGAGSFPNDMAVSAQAPYGVMLISKKDVFGNGGDVYLFGGSQQGVHIDPNGLLYETAPTMSIGGASTCTNISILAGSNTLRGQVTATCIAGQVVSLGFGATWASIPRCVVSPHDAIAANAGLFGSESTTVFTIGSANGTAATPAVFEYKCGG